MKPLPSPTLAVSTERYKDLNHALRKLKVQILAGVPYAQTECPKFDTPEQCFDWLKLRTTYRKDPKGRELFQTLPTLLSGSRTGTPGAGDCDCFTIAFLTLLVANGLYNDSGIVLVGRSKFLPPVHIYSYAGDEYADLTNKVYNYERFYKYRQHIPLTINPQEKMILELADNNELSSIELSNKAGRARRRHKRQLKKELKFKNDMENLRTTYDQSIPEISPEVDQNYTYLPNQEMHVRNDVYDDMGTAEFQNEMLSEGVSPAKILELSGARAARKMVKAKGKVQRKQTNTELKTRVSGADKAATRAKLFDKAGNIIGNFVGGKRVGGGGDDSAPSTPATSGGGFSFASIPTPVYVVGGLAILGTIAAVILKPRRATV